MDRLRTLCEVTEAGGIAKAAPGDPDRQSLFSRQIKELEAFFGTELLRRKGRGVEVTETGDRIARAAREHFRALEDILAHTHPERVGFHIAAGNSVLEWIVIPRLAKIRRILPRVRFRFLDMRSAEIVSALRDHRVDFGVVRANSVAHPLKSKSLGRIGYRLFAPASTKPTAVLSLPWALPAGTEFREEIERAAAAAGIRMESVFECQSFGQCASLVREGAAVAILPDSALPFMKGAVSQQPVWLADYQREIALVWRDRIEDLRPLAKDVAAALGNAGTKGR